MPPDTGDRLICPSVDAVRIHPFGEILDMPLSLWSLHFSLVSGNLTRTSTVLDIGL